MSMRVRCNDCGFTAEMPEGYLEGAATTFWRQHGHLPGSTTILCDCGATLDHGPKVIPAPSDREAMKQHAKASAAVAIAFYLAHRSHN